MKKIVLTSCGIIDEKLKRQFYELLDKDISNAKVLYITIAADGETSEDRSWIDSEFQSILDLGIKEENITEFKYQNNVDFCEYDIIYMLGGNTFYLMNELRENELDEKIKQAINEGTIYVGSSAGSIILGETIETALPYDENLVKLNNFDGLNIINGIIIPHANRKQEFIQESKAKYGDKIIELYDNYGVIIAEK